MYTSLSDPLGSFPHYDEFQIERTLIWVRIPEGGTRDMSLICANQVFPRVWNAIPLVLKVAEVKSRTLIPAYWEAMDRLETHDESLAIWSISIDGGTGIAAYDVFRNHDCLGRNEIPDIPEDHFVEVIRDQSGNLVVSHHS